MLTINLIREKKEFIIERLKVKNFEAGAIIDRILTLDSLRREIQLKSDMLQGEMNRISKISVR
jgi:seryl-tRNA synthetase